MRRMHEPSQSCPRCGRERPFEPPSKSSAEGRCPRCGLHLTDRPPREPSPPLAPEAKAATSTRETA